MSDRRQFLLHATTGLVASWIATHWRELDAASAYAATLSPDAPYQSLSPAEVRELDAITARIVPTDDTPGAREAQVVRFIDRVLSSFAKEQRPALDRAVEDVAGLVEKRAATHRSFARLKQDDQDAVLTEMSKDGGKRDSFFLLRDVTMAGMFSNPEYGGNQGKVGWKLIGFEDRYSWVPPFGYYDRG
jgi:gluconate 2-dehydrogenase gamma chain